MMSDSLKIVCWNGAITTYRRNAIIPHHVEEAASLVLRVDMEDERPRVTLLKSRYAPSELCAEWQERSKPQVDAELIELVQESIRQVRAAMDEVPLPPRTLNPCTVDRKALAGLRLAVQAHNTCTEDLLAAVEAGDARTPVPPELFEQAQRFADDSLGLRMPWMNIAMDRGDVIRDLLPHLRPEAAKPPTPDFATMSADERRAWLDERGRRELWEWVHGKWHARLWERHATNQLIIKVVAESEPAAILALCEAVAAKERGNDE